MKQFLSKIAAADFGKIAKRYIAATLLIVLLGGAFTAWMLRAQLSETAAWKTQNHALSSTQEESDEREGHHRHEPDIFDAEGVSPLSVGEKMTVLVYAALCGLCGVAYWLLVCAWLYQASGKAGMNKTFWTLAGAACNLLAVVVFLLVRSRMSYCQNCGTWQKEGQFCQSCGGALKKECPHCGARFKGTARFCPACGTALPEGIVNHAG